MSEQKTFTQDEVNAIVNERLSRDRKTAAAQIDERERDLQRRELELFAKSTLLEKGLPLELLAAVNMSGKDAFLKSVELIEPFAKTAQKADPHADKRELAAKILVDKGAKPDIVNDLLLDKIDYDSFSAEKPDKWLSPIMSRYGKYFGEIITVGAQVAMPPSIGRSAPSIEEQTREAMGLKR